ncbi:MAG: acyl-CoA dehydrogenase, partial [Gammaproteobacteria bacterium]|nr:acyl-CoA dehydrogenase [Gammaproteobacteria bacterium]
MVTLLSVIVILGIFGALSYFRVSLLLWSATVLFLLAILTHFTNDHPAMIVVWTLFVVVALFLNLSFLRRNFLTKPLFKMFKKVMPPMSQTEKEALEAGDVWWEGDLFSGKPNWKKLFRYPEARLTAEEKAFLSGPVQKLCDMINDYKIAVVDKDIPADVWQFIKDNGFLGMIVPKRFGGLEFSPYAHGRVAAKLYSCSITVATSVGVPNSLGPAELILHYGTDEQKAYYLPRLAKGQDIPCFALTGPEAGSDAGAMPDNGVVCYGEFKGEKVLGIRLNFNKRYITLAPIATIIGLAFKLYDPDGLLGDKKALGITCALLRRDEVQGMEIGRRHWPANNPFQNGPIKGKDVFIPIDWIIGGSKMAGAGWRMLMECLAVGRAISLPSTGVACTKIAAMSTGAYARVRKQFGLSVGKFSGVGEALGRIGAMAYWSEAAFKMTLAALNDGVKPAVPSGILKYHLTEAGRDALNDAMDIHAGKAVMMGPNNYLAAGYHGLPIGITVEGANILTRSLIIFGQGAMRCHPYVLKEMRAAQAESETVGLMRFDKVFFKHLGFTLSNMVRSFWLAVTSSRFTRVFPQPRVSRYQQHLTRFSSAFALLTDISMFVLGGKLKRKEQLSARLGDVLSKMYIMSAVLRRYQEEGNQVDDLPVVRWACDDALYTIQTQ